jgi:hypothetical protein
MHFWIAPPVGSSIGTMLAEVEASAGVVTAEVGALALGFSLVALALGVSWVGVALGVSLVLGVIDGVAEELVLGVGVGVVPVKGEQAAVWAVSAAVAAASRLASSTCACRTVRSSATSWPFCLPLGLPEEPLGLPEEPLVGLLLGLAVDWWDDWPELWPEDVPREALVVPDFWTDGALLEELAELADALAEADAASSASARSCSPEARSALAWITAASRAVVSIVAST